jgi:hypothetical protein
MTFSRSFVLVGAVALIWAAACGGTAIIDPPDGAGASGAAGGTGGTTTTSNGGSTTVSSGCDCTDANDCEQFTDECSTAQCNDCDCSYDSLPDGTPCSVGLCADSVCVECLNDEDCGPGGSCEAGTCVADVFGVCESACSAFDLCFGGGDPQCIDACIQDVADCSSSDLIELDQCTQTWLSVCDIDNWTACVPMSCVGNM